VRPPRLLTNLPRRAGWRRWPGFLLLMVAGISIRGRAPPGSPTRDLVTTRNLYTYLAIALAFSHQFANGGHVRGEPPGQGGPWSALYAVVGRALLLWYRVITPAAQRRPAPSSACSRWRPEAPGIVSVLITGAGTSTTWPRRGPASSSAGRFLTRRPCGGSPNPLLPLSHGPARPDADHRQGPRRATTRASLAPPAGPAPGSSPRAPTAPSPPLADRAAGCCSSPAASGHHPHPRHSFARAAQADVRGGITLPLPGQPPPRRRLQPASSTPSPPTATPPLHYLVGSRDQTRLRPHSTPTTCSAPSPACTATRPYVCGPTGP